MTRLFALLLLIGCPSEPGPAEAPRPPEACRSESTPDTWFSDQSDAIGLRELVVEGNRLSITDLDSDGWPDLAVSRATNGLRDDFEGTRQHHLLRNTGGDGFEDVLESSGFSATRDGDVGRAWNFALWGDVDNDGDLDGLAIVAKHEVDADHPDLGDRSEVLLNDGGSFTFAEADDLQAVWANSTSASLLDADRDGWLDLFVGNQYGVFGNHATSEQDRYYQGRADGRFRDRTEQAGLSVDSGGIPGTATAAAYSADMGQNVRWATFGTTVCDTDGDGDADLLTQTYGRGLNQHWENQGDGTFLSRTAESGWHSDLAEGGGDYSTDQRFRCHCQGAGAATEECQGVPNPIIGCTPGGWTPGWDDQPHRLAGNTFSAACGDLDGDGDLDVATGEIRHWWTPGASDPSTVLWNDGGDVTGWERRPLEDIGLALEQTTNNWNEGDLTVAIADLDNDGHADILRPQSDYPDTHMRLFHNDGDGTFTQRAAEVGIDFQRAASVALSDFDQDGDLDVFTTFSRMRCDADCEHATPEVHYFRNEVGHTRNTLQVRLVGTGGVNRSAIGARVAVTAGGRTQIQELGAGAGHQGVQHELMLSFGLGEACMADSVTVTWPDVEATTETWEAIPANWAVTLRKGDEQPTWRGWEP